MARSKSAQIFLLPPPATPPTPPKPQRKLAPAFEDFEEFKRTRAETFERLGVPLDDYAPSPAFVSMVMTRMRKEAGERLFDVFDRWFNSEFAAKIQPHPFALETLATPKCWARALADVEGE